MFIDAVGHLIERALTFLSMSPPAVSGAGQGRIFFNGTKFRVSENGGAYADLAGGAIPAGDWTVVFERRVAGGSLADPAAVNTGHTYDPKYDYVLGITYLTGGPAIGSSVVHFFSSIYIIPPTVTKGTYQFRYLPDGINPTTPYGACLINHKSQPLAFSEVFPYAVLLITTPKVQAIAMTSAAVFYTYYATPDADEFYFVIARRQVLP